MVIDYKKKHCYAFYLETDNNKMGVTGSSQTNYENDTLEDHVLLNHLILRTIFKYLTLKDLLPCRLVHSVWLKEATTILTKGDLLKEIAINTTPSHHAKLDNKSRHELKKLSLKSFIKVLESSKNFPCNKFQIQASLLDDSKLQDFLEACGCHIQQMSLRWFYQFRETTPENRKAFETLLVKQCPNLEILSINYFPEEFKDTDLSTGTEGKTQLDSLKVLSLKSSLPLGVLQWILTEAPNLTTIRILNDRFQEETLGTLLQLGKVHLIKDMSFDFKGERSLEVFGRLASKEPTLENIHQIQYIRAKRELLPKIVDILNKCLMSSSKTLKSIKIWHPLGSLTGLVLPTCPNLCYLHLNVKYHHHEIARMDCLKIFPEMEINLDLAETFPNLESVTMDFNDKVYELEPSQVFFDPAVLTPMTSVTRLSFIRWFNSSSIPPSWLRYLCTMFPNVKSLTLLRFVASDFPIASQIIWKDSFSKLAVLEILIFVEAPSSHSDLDASFTGFSKETCLDLYKKRRSWRSQSLDTIESDLNVEKLRANPSILDLKNLRKLEIDFGFQDDDKSNWTNGFLISEVTGRFAFEMCPLLEVMIVVYCRGLQQHLRRILPHAKVEFFDSPELQSGRRCCYPLTSGTEI